MYVYPYIQASKIGTLSYGVIGYVDGKSNPLN